MCWAISKRLKSCFLCTSLDVNNVNVHALKNSPLISILLSFFLKFVFKWNIIWTIWCSCFDIFLSANNWSNLLYLNECWSNAKWLEPGMFINDLLSCRRVTWMMNKVQQIFILWYHCYQRTVVDCPLWIVFAKTSRKKREKIWSLKSGR